MQRREPYNQLWLILLFVSIVLVILWIYQQKHMTSSRSSNTSASSAADRNQTNTDTASSATDQNRTDTDTASSRNAFDRYLTIEDPLRFRGTEESGIAESYQRVCYPSPAEKKEAKDTQTNGYYIVRPGDTLSKIAWIFHIDMKTIMLLNHIEKKDALRAGQKLLLPLSEEMIEAFLSGAYEVKEGDTLLGIAKRFGIDPKLFAKENNIVNSADIYPGRVMILPFAHLKPVSRKKRTKKRYPKFIKRFGKHALRVTATAYTSHCGQTDSTPFLAAWNNRLRPGMKAIAVSRDLIWKYGLKNGTKVRISGLPGIYRVRDKMNKRYRRRIDIYMGLNRKKALRWGRRSVVIYW
ncbi:Membrane-bound lytic murein transglycosylase D precursor [hydrothermal vent metagenome]|uniref:Membrane-bound lytic murein transglycosylase D n=1 Tax=hydrothermal vent metagenome TaxID=652676 RepID=A0A1W1E9W8_9ZZZZ